MTAYYKVNAINLSYGEVWAWGGDVSSFVVFALRKILRLPTFAPILIPADHALEPLATIEVPSAIGNAIDATRVELEGAGFRHLFYYRVATLGGGQKSGAAALLSQDRGSFAMVAGVQNGGLGEVSTSLVSRLSDGRYVATGNAVHRFRPPPEMDVVNLRGRLWVDVATEHAQRTKERARVLLSEEDFAPVLMDLHQLTIAFNERRGVYVRASDDDVARAHLADRRTRGG